MKKLIAIFCALCLMCAQAEIQITAGVTTVEPGTFEYDASVTEVTLPYSVTYVDSGAFSGCTYLSKVTVLNMNTEFDEAAFEDCPSVHFYAPAYSRCQAYCAEHGYAFTATSLDEAAARDWMLADESVSSVIFIKHTTGANASVRFYKKEHGGLSLIFTATAYIGSAGIGKTKEGDKKTPAGEYCVTGAFGRTAAPEGTRLDYIRITPTTWACADPEYYNQIIDTSELDHVCTASGSECMYSSATAYAYGLTINYNPDNVYGLGSAIFIHCKGSKSYTSGCIAMDRSKIITLLKYADAGTKVIIYE